MLKRTISVFLCATLLCAALAGVFTAQAAGVSVDGYEIPIDVTVNGVYLNKSARGYLGADGVTYVPVRGVSEALGATVTWNGTTNTAVVTKGDKMLCFNTVNSLCTANGIPKLAQIKLENGVMYVPARFLAENLGVDIQWDSFMYEVDLTLPGYVVPSGYVETAYNADDIYWLSRIVTCEAGSVSFNAKIMVANVIINRRTSKAFPNTIKDVIFDKKFGIQFPPAHNGFINKANPTTNTILACKVALNGVMLVPECMYFSYTSDNFSWVYHNCELYTTIGNQAFYK